MHASAASKPRHAPSTAILADPNRTNACDPRQLGNAVRWQRAGLGCGSLAAGRQRPSPRLREPANAASARSTVGRSAEHLRPRRRGLAATASIKGLAELPHRPKLSLALLNADRSSRKRARGPSQGGQRLPAVPELERLSCRAGRGTGPTAWASTPRWRCRSIRRGIEPCPRWPRTGQCRRRLPLPIQRSDAADEAVADS